MICGWSRAGQVLAGWALETWPEMPQQFAVDVLQHEFPQEFLQHEFPQEFAVDVLQLTRKTPQQFAVEFLQHEFPQVFLQLTRKFHRGLRATLERDPGRVGVDPGPLGVDPVTRAATWAE